MRCYVDSSVVLRYLVTEDMEFERVREFDEVGSSELMGIECRRVLHRYRLEGSISDTGLNELLVYFDELFESFRTFEMTRSVKQAASSAFPTVIGTLDAIHLATARLWAEQDSGPLVVFTFDEQMRICAGAMGLHTV